MNRITPRQLGRKTKNEEKHINISQKVKDDVVSYIAKKTGAVVTFYSDMDRATVLCEGFILKVAETAWYLTVSMREMRKAKTDDAVRKLLYARADNKIFNYDKVHL